MYPQLGRKIELQSQSAVEIQRLQVLGQWKKNSELAKINKLPGLENTKSLQASLDFWDSKLSANKKVLKELEAKKTYSDSYKTGTGTWGQKAALGSMLVGGITLVTGLIGIATTNKNEAYLSKKDLEDKNWLLKYELISSFNQAILDMRTSHVREKSNKHLLYSGVLNK